MKRIALHKMRIYGHRAIISTVDLGGKFETMVIYEDGEELEVLYSDSLEEARKTHNRIMHKYNDLIYDGSIEKCLGFANIGQFVKTVKAC